MCQGVWNGQRGSSKVGLGGLRGYRDICCTGLLWFAPHLLGCAPGSQGRDGEGGSVHTLFVLSCNTIEGEGEGEGETWPGLYCAQFGPLSSSFPF